MKAMVLARAVLPTNLSIETIQSKRIKAIFFMVALLGLLAGAGCKSQGQTAALIGTGIGDLAG